MRSLKNHCVDGVGILTQFALLSTILASGDKSLAQEIIQRRPFMYVDSLTFVPGIGHEQINDMKDQAVACA